MNPVKFTNVSHFYDQRKVLDSIDLTFDDEKITVILDKSGSGKSTLLQMINGLIVPSRGIVEVFMLFYRFYEIQPPLCFLLIRC